jgi:hypothetical protein
MLVQSLIKTKQQMHMSNAELFKFINKDGGPLVSRDDFKDVLKHLNMKQIREQDITQFIDYFYKETEGGMDMNTFLRHFEKFENQQNLEDKRDQEERDMQEEQDQQLKEVNIGFQKESELQRRVESLNDKVKEAYRQVILEQEQFKLKEQELAVLQKAHDKLRVNYDHTKDEMLKLKKEKADLHEKQREMAPADEARRVTQDSKKLKEQLEETRAALLSYKSMHNVVCSQVESLKLMHERTKDEQNT